MLLDLWPHGDSSNNRCEVTVPDILTCDIGEVSDLLRCRVPDADLVRLDVSVPDFCHVNITIPDDYNRCPTPEAE